MAETGRDGTTVNARIAYWGAEGAGKTANLESVHAKLRPDHRGDLDAVPTRLDPSVTYEILPIELGEIAGVRTQIQIIALPGAPEHAPTRKQLLDEIDGIVLVLDSQRERIDDNVETQRDVHLFATRLVVYLHIYIALLIARKGGSREFFGM